MVLRTLQRIYSKQPRFSCKGFCTDCCKKLLGQLLGYLHQLTC